MSRRWTVQLRHGSAPALVGERFSWAGFLFGPLYLAACAAWVPAILSASLGAFLMLVAPAFLVGYAFVGLFFLIGLTARDLVRWSLERRGFMLAHVVVATNRDAAALRLLATRPDLIVPLPGDGLNGRG